MGRRKIEIKPIRDDRNRSVTFLKRKGGLFKKAHELSVLCSVDVAVIIFGHNKKLYEYSSSDINEIIGRFQYYGGAHEHKGPNDFTDKGGDDDDDDEGDGGGDVDERNTPVPEHHVVHPHMQNHPGFHNVRHGTPTASPPMPNGVMPQFNRGPSPIPPGMSRPSSRTSQHAGHNRRTSANYAPTHGHPSQPPHPPQPGYGFPPQPPFYGQQPPGQMQNRHITHGHQATYPPPSFPPASQPAQAAQVQQAYMQHNRGGSMPPAYPAPAQITGPTVGSRHPSQEHLQPPPPPPPPHRSPRLPQQRPTPSPQPVQQEFASPPLPQPKPLPAIAKTHSIFTPIDDSRSMLAQTWGTSSITSDLNKTEPVVKPEDGGPRSQSIDIASMQRGKQGIANGSSNNTPPSSRARSPKQKGQPQSSSNAPSIQAPSRSGTNQSDTKRPRLKVQIPSEHSDEEGAAGSGKEEPNTSRPPQQPQHSVVLPPPSPSASALLSAGAQGPPNPFARPAPPMNTNSHNMSRDSNHVETPISALPSRFMSDNLLPSPSTFYPEWGFGRSGDSNMLPSPLNFQTPVVSNGAGWRDDERKRAHEEDTSGGDAKRNKS